MLADIFPRTAEDMTVATTGESAATYAMDAGLKSAFRDKIEIRNEILDKFGDHFIGWAACAMLKQRWIIDRACSIPAQDAAAPGFTVALADTTDGEPELDAEDLTLIEQEDVNKYFVFDALKKANVTKKVFGQSLVIPVFDDEKFDYSKPLNYDGIKKGSYKGLAVIEPMWYTPQLDGKSIDPASGRFYDPAYYLLSNGRKIHCSWCVKLVNSDVPDLLKPVYFYGGVPLTQQIFERVFAAETTANEAPNMAMTKRLTAIEADMEVLIANPEYAEERISALTELRNNYGVQVIPTGSNMHQFDTSLTDFDQLIMTQYQLVASIAQMPVTKLLKVQVKGFDATGEFEHKDYLQSLVSIQENDWQQILAIHHNLLTKSEFGKVIPLRSIWREIDTPGRKESAEIQEIKARKDSILISAGVISADEVRQRLRADKDSEYTAIEDISDDENLEDEENEIERLVSAIGNTGEEAENSGNGAESATKEDITETITEKTFE